MGRVIITIHLLLVVVIAHGQAGWIKRGLKFQQEERLDKVEILMQKALAKDSTYPGGYYLKALLYFHPAYSATNIDSALLYVNTARHLFTQLDTKERDKLSKAGAGPMAMESLKQRVDSAGYARAKKKNSEQSYLFFLANFPGSRFEAEAISERNMRAFEDARNVNTYQSYLAFMKKYPDAGQYDEAKFRYEKLYFDKSTADGKMASYQKFLKQHPTTPYRNEAENKIYQVMTASNARKDYLKFIDQYPKSKKARQAKDFLFHLLKEEEALQAYPKSFKTDSLITVLEMDQPLITFLEKRQYGLMDLDGKEVLSARFPKVPKRYLCGLVEDDFILAGEKLFAKNGMAVLAEVEEVKDLGYGWLKAGGKGRYRLVHKSGVTLSDRYYQDLKVLNGKFIAYHYKGAWGLMTMSGIQLAEEKFDDIFQLDGFLLFEKDGLLDIKIGDQLIAAADNRSLRFQLLFTDYELLEKGKLWLQSSYGEVVYDGQLNELIPYEPQKISLLPYGYLVQEKGGYWMLNDAFEVVNKDPLNKVAYNTSYLALKQDSTWSLLKAANYVEVAQGLDSLVLTNDHFAIACRQDSTLLFFRDTSHILLEEGSTVTVLSSSGGAEFVQIISDKRKKVLDEAGQTVLEGRFEDVSARGEYLVISEKEKKALYSVKGRLLKAEYDAIGDAGKGYVSLLKNRKFGLYSESDTVHIPPQYDKPLEKYDRYIFIAQKEGKRGLLDREGNSLSDFIYNEVEYWNDSVALVKENDLWEFYNFSDQRLIGHTLKTFSYAENTEDEIIIIALGENGYGVLSNRRGEVIPLSFNDVVNIGNPGTPVYFTEKHISEAEFYVLIYYDKEGNVIRKQALESGDYDLIYCDK